MTTIRQATIDDADALTHLAERTFRDTFTTADNHADMTLYCAETFAPAIQRQEILDPNGVTLLALVENQRVGFAQVRCYSPKPCVSAEHPSELHRLYVDKAWHGRGVAHTLMAHVLSTAAAAGADRIWLGVWEHNPRAIAFYRKYGFQVVGAHAFQFGHDRQEDLIMMTEVSPDQGWG